MSPRKDENIETSTSFTSRGSNLIYCNRHCYCSDTSRQDKVSDARNFAVGYRDLYTPLTGFSTRTSTPSRQWTLLKDTSTISSLSVICPLFQHAMALNQSVASLYIPTSGEAKQAERVKVPGQVSTACVYVPKRIDLEPTPPFRQTLQLISILPHKPPPSPQSSAVRLRLCLRPLGRLCCDA